MTSGGESACSLNAGYLLLTARNRSSYHASGRSGLWPPCRSSCTPPRARVSIDLAEDLVEPQHVAVGRSDRSVERAEVAPRHTDVGVVDVAVDDVGDDALGMFAGADGRRRGAPGAPWAPADTARALRAESRGRRPDFAFELGDRHPDVLRYPRPATRIRASDRTPRQCSRTAPVGPTSVGANHPIRRTHCSPDLKVGPTNNASSPTRAASENAIGRMASTRS